MTAFLASRRIFICAGMLCGLILTAPAMADRTGAARLALEAARQRLDAANHEVSLAAQDLERTVQDQRQAQERLDNANKDFDVAENLIRDPHLLDDAAADTRSAQHLAADRADALKEAQARLAIAREALSKMAPPTTNPSQPVDSSVAAVQQAVGVGEAEVARRNQELAAANTAWQQAQERERKINALAHSIAGGQGFAQQEQFIAEQQLNLATRALNDAETRFHQALDSQTRARWGLDASDREFQLAVIDARREEQDRLQPRQEPLKRDVNRDVLRQEQDVRLLGRNLIGPFGADSLNPTDISLGAERERELIQQSRDDALRRNDQARESTRQK